MPFNGDMTTSTQIRMAARPVGEPSPSDFETTTEELPAPAEGQVLLRTLWLSLDPYMRGRMSDAPSYAAPLELGDVMLGGTVCEVVESRSDSRQVGDVVLAFAGWQTHAVVDARQTRRLDPTAAPVSTALGVLGMPGFTAYGGLLELGRPQPGETVVTAAAAGPVGSAVGQIARVKGARAVGIAGGAEKCRILLDEYGFDAAVDHRSSTFVDDLAAATPDGIDVYFENVGGAILEAVLDNLAMHARLVLCGMISCYNEPLPGPTNLFQLVPYRARMQGFILFDYAARMPEGAAALAGWLQEGKLRYRTDVQHGFENVPRTFLRLFTGENQGKQLLQL
jgi:NADPH-dependent curcumin reductase